MTATTVVDVLRLAADILERDGWVQGKYHSPQGCHCAEGAIAYAVGQHAPLNPDAADPDSQWMPMPYGWMFHTLSSDVGRLRLETEQALAAAVSPEVSVVEWNDRVGRTADEVIATMRATADLLAAA